MEFKLQLKLFVRVAVSRGTLGSINHKTIKEVKYVITYNLIISNSRYFSHRNLESSLCFKSIKDVGIYIFFLGGGGSEIPMLQEIRR